MLATIEGYFDGTNIVPEEECNLKQGQRVFITILDNSESRSDEGTAKVEKMMNGMKRFREIIGEDKGWASEEEMMEDVSRFRRERAYS